MSVVIPTRNRSALVVQSLRSVLDQRDVKLEVIVVDDGSSDRTVELLNQVTDPRLRVMRHDTSEGVSAARNTGISAARGRWLAFLDDDDIFAPEKLASQLEAVGQDGQAGWCCVGVVVVNASLRIMDWLPAPRAGDLAARTLVHNVVPGGGSGVLVSRDLLDIAGWFDPNLSCLADWDMWLRLAQASPVAAVNRPLLAYRTHRAAMSLDVARCDSDYRFMVAKHSSVYSSSGLRPDDLGWELTKIRTFLQGGKRRAALRSLVALGRRRRPLRRLVSAAALSVVPFGMVMNAERRRRAVPAAWRTEADTWLAAYGRMDTAR